MNRTLRVRPQVSDDIGSYTDSDSDRESNSSPNEGNELITNSGMEGDSEEAEDDEEEEDNARTAISQISFAALAKAQDSLTKQHCRKSVRAKSSQKHLNAHLDRPSPKSDNQRKEKKNHPRTSKNAPQEISSRRAVTRKREVVQPATRQKARDPRFDAAVNARYDEREFRKNYAFLDDYRNEEMKIMKEEIKKTKDERKGEQLAKKLKSMESQLQTQQNKDKVQEVLRNHKKKERELVKQGKKAFHIKPRDVKRLVQEERFSKMSEKQQESTIARKQKRKAQKERKNMPWERREV